MDVEKYGDTRVLSVEVREPDQMTIPGVAPRERVKPHKPAAPDRPASPADKPAEAQSHKGRATFTPCLHCAHYQQQPWQDEHGVFVWGKCKRTGEPIYSLRKGCRAWEEKLGPM